MSSPKYHPRTTTLCEGKQLPGLESLRQFFLPCHGVESTGVYEVLLLDNARRRKLRELYATPILKNPSLSWVVLCGPHSSVLGFRRLSGSRANRKRPFKVRELCQVCKILGRLPKLSSLWGSLHCIQCWVCAPNIGHKEKSYQRGNADALSPRTNFWDWSHQQDTHASLLAFDHAVMYGEVAGRQDG